MQNILLSLFIVFSVISHTAFPAVVTAATESKQEVHAIENTPSDIAIDLLYTCKERNEKDALVLIEKGAPLDYQDPGCGLSALMVASRYGLLTAVVTMLNRSDKESVKKILNLQDIQGNTALHHAARNNHHLIAKFLIESGADMEMCADKNYTPLLIAAHYAHGYTMEVLLDAGANQEATLTNGATFSGILTIAITNKLINRLEKTTISS